MADWLDSYAAALGVSPLTDDEIDTLLELTREVAHGTERRFAPLSAFLAGVLAGSSGQERTAAVRAAVTAAEELLDHGSDGGG